MKYNSTREKKFDDIYIEYSDHIYKVCYYLTKDEDLALDMMQQSFLNFYKHFESVNPDFIFAYLVRTAKNTVFNYYRHTKHEVSTATIYESSHPDEFLSDTLEEEYFHSERQKLERELGRQIMKDLHEENRDYYQIFKMLYYDEKSGVQVARKMGFSRDALYSRMYRAKQWIRKRYTEDYEKIKDMT